MLNLAVRDGLLARNPLARCKVRQPEPKSARIYGKADLRAMLAACPTPWWRALIKLAYTSGLRAGELLSLRWEDVDLDGGLVNVRPKEAATITVDGQDYRLLAWTAKSHRAYRSVPIPDDTVAVLRAHRQQTDGSPYLFLSLERLRRVGEKMAAGNWRADAKLANNMLRDFRAIHNAAGLAAPAGTIHDLRKSWCTAMAAAVPMDTLQRWAGHSNISTTATYYCRERAEDATKARTAMRDETPDLRLVG